MDAHYEKINKKVYEEFSFDYNKVKNDKFKSKYSSIYNIFSGTKRGLMKILNYSFIKKLLLVGFFMSSMFIMYSVSSIMGTFNIKEKDFVNYNKNYLLLTKNNMTKSEYDKISNMNNVNYVIPTDGMVTLNFKFGNYLQTSGIMQTINGNLASSSLVDKIISGTKIKNNNEIIIDKLVIDKFLSMSDAKNAGYLTYDSFIKESVYLKDGQEYKIVGISDTSSPSIYARDSELINIIDNFINDDYLMEETTSYKDYKRVNASLTSGRYPVNDYEVIVSEFNKYDYPLNKEIDNKIGNTRLKVVGYYKSNETSDFLVSENTIKNKLIFNSNNFVISSKDKKSVINELKSEKYNVVDTYENSLSTYKKNLKDANKSKIMYSSVIVVISLIEMYLIIRSSFLSRVKEVGILRSIGIKRKDIYKMFMGEILSITLISSVPGLLFMSYVLYTLSKIEVLNILINPLVFIISLLIVVFFNLIFGLLPVYRIVKKTPHEILSRNDVD